MFGWKFGKSILIFGCVAIIRDTMHQFFSVLFGGCVNADAVRASGNWVVRVRAKVGIFGHVLCKQRFKTFVQPLACLRKVSFGGGKEKSSIGVSSLDRAAPFVFKDDLPKSHSAVRVLRVVHMDVKFEVGVGNSCHRNSCKVVKVFVVVAYEVLIGRRADYSHDTTE